MSYDHDPAALRMPLDLREYLANRRLWEADPDFARELGIKEPQRQVSQPPPPPASSDTGHLVR